MRNIFILVVSFSFFLYGCKENKKPEVEMNHIDDKEAIEVDKVNSDNDTVELINRKGEKIGEATFVEKDNGVMITVEARNLQLGLHGIHIHEKGLCEPPDFETAGAHFNPDDKAHGFNHQNGPHAGDLPNLNVTEDGTVIFEYLNERVTLVENKAHSLRDSNGSSLIIHAKKDDYITQPAGDAGERIACGVISKPH